jgi:hypothetical protein
MIGLCNFVFALLLYSKYQLLNVGAAASKGWYGIFPHC